MPKWAKWFKGGSSEASPAPELPVDLTAPAFVADPYPVYEALRRDHPLAEVASGGMLLTRHADVMAALGDKALGNAPSRFSVLAARNKDKHTAAAVAAHIPPFLDMPEHRLPRQALTRAFFDTFAQHQERLPDLAARCIDEAPARCDLVSAIASPFALRSMAGFVGLEAAPETLKPLSRAFFHLFAPVTDAAQFAEVNARLDEARALIGASLEARRAAPGADLISALLAFQAGAPDLSDAQIIDLALLVFADGIENIEAGCAIALHRLTLEEAEANEASIREALRLNTPGQIVPRVTREATALHGRALTPGTPVFLALGSANTDPEAFAEAGKFDPNRGEAAATFGMGRHRCIGEPMAIAQITALVAGAQQAGLRPDSTGPMRYALRFGHRWPAALQVSRPA